MQENQKKATSHEETRSSDDLLRIVEFIQSFGSIDALEEAVVEYKEKGDLATIKVRTAIIQTLRELFLHECLADVVKAFDSLRKSIESVGGQAHEVLSAISDDNLAGFLVSGTLKSRFDKDSPEPKKRTASYVSETFFPDAMVTCFIQASITAIHLARELTKRPIRPGSIFHTNSVVLPLMLLQKHSHIRVYPYCGSAYDNLCGGWLPHNEESWCHDWLDNLLTNPPVHTSFITPMAVTSDTGNLLFTRTELTHVVERLVKHTATPVIMTFSSRVFENENSAIERIRNNSLHPIPNTNWYDRKSTAQLVVAWDESSTYYDNIPGKVAELAKLGFDVHWQEPNFNWNLQPAS